MKILDTLRRIFRSAESTDTSTSAQAVINARGWRGISVNGGACAEPMKIATVYRCVDILSGSIASLLLQPQRYVSAGQNEVTGEKEGFFRADQLNDLYPLLTLRANSRMTSFEFLKNLVSQVLLQGNAYVVPAYTGGAISELILLDPHTVSYDKYNNTYTINSNLTGVMGLYTADEVIHVRNVSLDGGYTGVSTIMYAANSLNIAAASDNKQDELFQPGSTLRGYMSGTEDLTRGFGAVQDTQLQTVTDRVESEISSGKRIFQVPGAMKFNPLTLSPADLQLLESKSFNVIEICRFFGVHPDKVFSQGTTNYKASENTQTAFMTDTLQPMLVRIENEFTIKLIPKKLWAKYRIKFDLDDYYQVDINTKSDYMTKTIQAGVYTVNEWRRKEGRMPVPGGDIAFVSCNVAPINSAKIKGEVTTPVLEPANPAV